MSGAVLLPTTVLAATEVTTEEGLLTALETGGEIQLAADIELTDALVIETSVTLDLNGHTITHPQDAEGEAAILIQNGAAVVLKDSSNGQGAVRELDSGNWRCIDVASSASLTIESGAISGGSQRNVWNNYSTTVILKGGTYDRGVGVTSILGGTFTPLDPEDNNNFIEADAIHGGTFAEGTEVQAYSIAGGTFNGDADCLRKGEITGGTFNGNLHIWAEVTAVSGCTINGSLEWKDSSMPTFTDVTFGEELKLWNEGYEIVDDQLQAIPKYSILVTSADSAMGTVTVNGFVRNPDEVLAITPSTPANGGRLWENAYRGATVTIRSATAEAEDGYVFLGWYDNAQGEGQLVSTLAELSYQSDEQGVQEDLSFYAVFADDTAYAEQVAAAEAWLAQYASASAYEIHSIADMQSFTIAVNYLQRDFNDKTVRLAASLNYGATDDFTPIGNSGIAFLGTFDGAEHAISGLHYATANQSSAYVGLFGNLGSGAAIQDLTLSGVDFSGGWMTGAFAGHADGASFTNCKLTGNSTLADAYFLGGIFGHGNVANTVENCTVEYSTIDGYWKTGGVAGYVCGVTVSGTTVADSAFPGTGFTGALIGHSNDGPATLTNVIVSGTTDGKSGKISLAGTNYAGGANETITLSGDETNVDAAGILQSASGGDVVVEGGSYSFALPAEQIPDGQISVTFMDAEELVLVQVVAPQSPVSLPAAPEKENYDFTGWYLSDGETEVTAETAFADDTEVYAKWRALASGISLNRNELLLVVGRSARLTATLTPAEAESAIVWASDDTDVAAVDEAGIVTAKAPGFARITATANGFSAACDVVVIARGGSGSSSGSSVTTYAVSVPADVEGGTVKVSPSRAASGATVRITIMPEAGYELDKLAVRDADGDALKLTGVGADEYRFQMPAAKVEIEVSFRKIVAEAENPFLDIQPGDYYYEAVLWAVENGVTSGSNAEGTLFGPALTVSRAQMVTFLWRAYGSPQVAGNNPFQDVSSSDYYYHAVLWAVQNGVTGGLSATTFGPDAPVTRAQAVTFQWRAVGCPQVAGGSFADVPATAYYADAAAWAVAVGVTEGAGGDNFSPELPVSRAQAVTFLYREGENNGD